MSSLLVRLWIGDRLVESIDYWVAVPPRGEAVLVLDELRDPCPDPRTQGKWLHRVASVTFGAEDMASRYMDVQVVHVTLDPEPIP